MRSKYAVVDRPKYATGKESWRCRLIVGNQYFMIIRETTRKEAEWFADMLTHAINAIRKDARKGYVKARDYNNVNDRHGKPLVKDGKIVRLPVKRLCGNCGDKMCIWRGMRDGCKDWKPRRKG